mmetsp:Transcript_3804/g.3874  ORF Transcript_3804/g.3874 Transcript_3804/m.3874 type:complete len:459 (+) Transcript_3804:3-1379(+)
MHFAPIQFKTVEEKEKKLKMRIIDENYLGLKDLEDIIIEDVINLAEVRIEQFKRTLLPELISNVQENLEIYKRKLKLATTSKKNKLTKSNANNNDLNSNSNNKNNQNQNKVNISNDSFMKNQSNIICVKADNTIVNSNSNNDNIHYGNNAPSNSIPEPFNPINEGKFSDNEGKQYEKAEVIYSNFNDNGLSSNEPSVPINNYRYNQNNPQTQNQNIYSKCGDIDLNHPHQFHDNNIYNNNNMNCNLEHKNDFNNNNQFSALGKTLTNINNIDLSEILEASIQDFTFETGRISRNRNQEEELIKFTNKSAFTLDFSQYDLICKFNIDGVVNNKLFKTDCSFSLYSDQIKPEECFDMILNLTPFSISNKDQMYSLVIEIQLVSKKDKDEVSQTLFLPIKFVYRNSKDIKDNHPLLSKYFNDLNHIKSILGPENKKSDFEIVDLIANNNGNVETVLNGFFN